MHKPGVIALLADSSEISSPSSPGTLNVRRLDDLNPYTYKPLFSPFLDPRALRSCRSGPCGAESSLAYHQREHSAWDLVGRRLIV